MSGSNTDRLAEIPSFAEALTEIRRMGQRIAELESINAQMATRILELESHAAVTFGTLERPTPDWPTKIEHNIPPSAPPHDE